MVISQPIAVGLVNFAASWFSEIGHDLIKTSIAPRSEELRRYLQRHYRLLDAGVVTTPKEATEAALNLQRSGIDVALLAFPAWSEDETLLAFARTLSATRIWIVDLGSYAKMPPHVSDQKVFFAHTELVGLLQANATAHRTLSTYEVLRWNGESDASSKSLATALRALSALKTLSSAKIGVLPNRTSAIRCTIVDELAIAKTLGCRLDYISIAEAFRVFRQVPDDQVKEYVRKIKARLSCSMPSTEASYESAKLACALKKITGDHSLDALAIDDLSPELHSTFGLRPCLVDRISLKNCPPIALEGDASAAASMLVLERLGCRATALVEPFFCMPSSGAILFGHAGGCDPDMGESDSVAIEPDMEYLHSTDRFPGSPSIMVTGRPGKGTLVGLQMNATARRIIAMRCKLLPHQRVLPGYSEFSVQFEHSPEDVLSFLVESGCSQHFVLGNSDVFEEVMMLAKFVGIEARFL